MVKEDFPEDWDDEVLKKVEIGELMDTIADAAKRICGTRPTDEQIKMFLEGIKNLAGQTKLE